MRHIFITPQFKKDMRKLPKKVIAKADRLLSILSSDPKDSQIDTRKLNKIRAKAWRVKVGRYRIIYSFDKTSLTLHRFRHRKDVYKNL